MKKSLLSVVLCVALLMSNVVGLFAVSAAGDIDLLDGATVTGGTLENGVLTVTGDAGTVATIVPSQSTTIEAAPCFSFALSSDAMFDIKFVDTNGFSPSLSADFNGNYEGGSYDGIPAGDWEKTQSLLGSYNWNKASQTATVARIEITLKAAGTLTLTKMVQTDGLSIVDVTSDSYAENADWAAESMLVSDSDAWTSVAGGGGDATVSASGDGLVVSASTGWPAAAHDFAVPYVVDWATSAIYVDYSVRAQSRIMLFYGASSNADYASNEYVDLTSAELNGTDLNTGRYTGTIMLSDIIPESSVAEDGTVALNGLKIFAIGSGNCVFVNAIDVLTVREGAYTNPYQLTVGGRVVAVLEPGAEAYVQVDDANGTIATVYGAIDGEDAIEGWFVQYGRMPAYPGANAEATVEMNSFSDMFSVMNTSETDTVVLYMSLAAAPVSNTGTYADGSEEPVENVDGSYVVVDGSYVTKTDGTEIMNTYIAEADGAVTVTINTADGWFYVVNNLTAGVYGDTQWSDSDPVAPSTIVDVTAGDELQIVINTYDPASPWTAPAGEIAWSIELAASCAHANVEYVAASCYNVEHWFCADCEGYWLDEALTQVTNRLSVLIDPAHTLEYVAASCYNVEHWYCSACDSYWLDEECTQLTNRLNVVISPAAHNAEYVAESCYNVEHWFCADCEGYWLDEACTQVTNRLSVVKSPATHNAEYVAESCYNVEHWFCADCEGYWLDEACTQVTNRLSVVKSPATHNAEYVAASCYNVEHWFCADCEGYWLDEALTQVTNHNSVLIAPAHTLEHVAAVDPTATENGNVEYWYCSACDSYWLDEACTQLTNRLSVILPATGVTVLRGDVDCNGKVEIADALMLFHYINGKLIPTEQGLVNAEITDDGDVTILDANKLFNYINGKIAEV